MFSKLQLYFFEVEYSVDPILGTVGPIALKWKGSALVGDLDDYVTSALDLIHDLALRFPSSNFETSVGIGGLIYVKRKRWKSVGYWAIFVSLPFNHTHDFGIEYQGQI